MPNQITSFLTGVGKVLSKFANNKGLKISINFQIAPEEGISKQRIEETQNALRKLGLDDNVKVE